MIARTRFSGFVNTLALYAIAIAVIGYFSFHAYHGERGINAKTQFIAEIDQLNSELQDLKRERAGLQRRVSLLEASAIDPDMLEQRARQVLNFAFPQDIVSFDAARQK